MIEPYTIVQLLGIITFALQAAIIASAVIWLLNKAGLINLYENAKMQVINSKIEEYYREIVLLIASSATAGSLYTSEIMEFEPCLLCWYQRIFMYPLVLLAGTSVLLRKDDLDEYALPLIIIGGAIAFYHIFVQVAGDILPSGCGTDVPCTLAYISELGYITIPVMAFTTFLTMGILIWRYK